jgi:hypothetical protein
LRITNSYTPFRRITNPAGRENVTENRENLILQFICTISQKIEYDKDDNPSGFGKIKRKRLIERVGPDKGGYWKIL